jgi:hypothetical protein
MNQIGVIRISQYRSLKTLLSNAAIEVCERDNKMALPLNVLRSRTVISPSLWRSLRLMWRYVYDRTTNMAPPGDQ